MTKAPDHRLERLMFFSDAVFAIAITLLVIEIHVPDVTAMTDRGFLAGLARLIPQFIGFTVSFFVIGAFWGGHHRAFACAKGWDERIVFPNLTLLFTVAAMPFFTAFSSEYSVHRVPVAAYTFWLLLTALANMRLQRIVTRPPVVDPAAVPAQLALIRRRGQATALGASTAFVVSLVYAPFALVSLLSIPLWRLALDRLAIRRSPG